MKKSRFEFWQILYPIAIYYVVMSLSYFGLEVILGATTGENYMVRQLLCGAITIPFLLRLYLSDKKMRDVVYGEKKFKPNGKQIKTILLTIATAATAGIAVNNLIAMTPMVELSQGFQDANASFFGGEVLFQILGSCIIIPIAEELVFRGVVYQRLRIHFDVPKALILSAVIFGIVHTNVVQFIYATLLGSLLAFLYEKSGFFYVPVLGHAVANTIAVIRTATGWLMFSYEPTAAGIGVTLAFLVAAAGLIWYQVREWQAERKGKI